MIEKFDIDFIDKIYDITEKDFKKFICGEYSCKFNEIIDAVNALVYEHDKDSDWYDGQTRPENVQPDTKSRPVNVQTTYTADGITRTFFGKKCKVEFDVPPETQTHITITETKDITSLYMDGNHRYSHRYIGGLNGGKDRCPFDGETLPLRALQEIHRTRKALGVALDAIDKGEAALIGCQEADDKYISDITAEDGLELMSKAYKQIKALEQKDK